MNILPVDFLLYRGPRPKLPQELLWWLPGVKCIINLQSGIYELVNQDEGEAMIWGLRGITEHTIPLSDYKRPSELQLIEIVTLIFKETHQHMHSTYIHCKHGVDRTGMVCAAYEILVLGRGPNVAIEDMRRRGFHRFPYFYWERTLHQLATPHWRNTFLKYLESHELISAQGGSTP